MAPRTLALIILATLLAPANAGETNKPAKKVARTWKTVVEYVLKNGGEDSIKAPSTRTLGYTSDVVFMKSLGLDDNKSKDRMDHSIYILREKDSSGALSPKEIVLSTILVKEKGSQKEIDGHMVRTTLNGTPIHGMHASGIVGQVVQQPLPPDSKELRAFLKKESSLYLTEIDLALLTQ